MGHEGVYLAYFSAQFGNSMGIFLIRKKEIVGGDIGGGIYKGTFEVKEHKAVGTILFSTREGGVTITGARTDLPASYETLFEFQLPIQDQAYHPLETAYGPVNIKFEKISDLDD